MHFTIGRIIHKLLLPLHICWRHQRLLQKKKKILKTSYEVLFLLSESGTKQKRPIRVALHPGLTTNECECTWVRGRLDEQPQAEDGKQNFKKKEGKLTTGENWGRKRWRDGERNNKGNHPLYFSCRSVYAETELIWSIQITDFLFFLRIVFPIFGRN